MFICELRGLYLVWMFRSKDLKLGNHQAYNKNYDLSHDQFHQAGIKQYQTNNKANKRDYQTKGSQYSHQING